MPAASQSVRVASDGHTTTAASSRTRSRNRVNTATPRRVKCEGSWRKWRSCTVATIGAVDAAATWAVECTTSTAPGGPLDPRSPQPLPRVVQRDPRQGQGTHVDGRLPRRGRRRSVPGAHPDLLDVTAFADGVDGVERGAGGAARAPGASTARG